MFNNKLSEYNILKKIENELKKDFGLTAHLGAELEFYLLGLQNDLQLFNLEKAIKQKIKKEKGPGQYEIEIPPSIHVAYYPAIIRKMRDSLCKEASKLKIKANFCAKPFPDDYGNSMHIHFNFLEDNSVKNIEKYAEILCHYLPETINYFLQKNEDYQRLDSRFMAPTHISYGGNNRTTLIRIPDLQPHRLEHRLAAADADPYKVIYAILNSILWGLKNPKKIKKIQKVYGNAYDLQYNLVKIVN